MFLKDLFKENIKGKLKLEKNVVKKEEELCQSLEVTRVFKKGKTLPIIEKKNKYYVDFGKPIVDTLYTQWERYVPIEDAQKWGEIILN